MIDTLETDLLFIDGRLWRIPKSANLSREWVPLRPTDGTSEGGVLLLEFDRDPFIAALPDNVTTARARTFAAQHGGAFGAVGAANVWHLWPSGTRPLLHPTGKLHLAVLRALAKHPGQWVCSRTLNAESSWRFASHVKQLRDRHGYPIESARCNDVLHSHHKATVGAYRLPGLNGSS